MTKTLVYIGIVVLAVIAVVLGYQIYQQTRVSQTPVYQTPPVQQTQDTTTLPSGNNQQSTQQTTIQKLELTAEEKQVLNFPGPNASETERKAHSDLVNRLGNQSGVAFLDISGCVPTPVVYRVKLLGGTFKVKNSDQTEHTIYTDRKTTIKANSEQTLASKDIGDNLGDYGYSCDGSTSPVGIIQIVP